MFLANLFASMCVVNQRRELLFMIQWYKNATVSFLRDHSKCDFLIFNALNYTKKRFVYFPLDLIYVFVPAIQIELLNNLEDKQKENID